MSLKGFLALVLFTDILAWTAWGILLTTTTPVAGVPIIILFYASLLLALLGLFAVIGFASRIYFKKRDELIVMYVRRTFRQGFLLASLFVITLILLHQEVLRWWVLLVVLAIIGIIEHYYARLEN
jgi:hypothetical protein